MCFHWHQVKGREREDGGGGGVGGAGHDKRHIHSFSWLRLQHVAAPVGQRAWGSGLAVCPGQTANIWWNASCVPAHQLAAFPFFSLFTCLLEVYIGTHCKSLRGLLQWRLMLMRTSLLTAWSPAWRGWSDDPFFAASIHTALCLEHGVENREQYCTSTWTALYYKLNGGRNYKHHPCMTLLFFFGDLRISVRPATLAIGRNEWA